MVPKDCGFNQSETACGLCACIASRFPCLPATARDGELFQTQHFFHHGDTICRPNSSYVTTKRYETSACECNNNTIFQKKQFSHDRRRMPGTLAHALMMHAKAEDGDTVEFIIFRV